MKWLKRIALLLGVFFLLIQLIRPARTNPPVDQSKTIQARTQMPAEVARIIERSCSDCHSNQTRWPWYSQIAPVSWLVARDVREAREKMNFSEWGNYQPKKAAHLLEAMSENVGAGAMPLPRYLRLHPEAVLTEEEKTKLLDWIVEEVARGGV